MRDGLAGCVDPEDAAGVPDVGTGRIRREHPLQYRRVARASPTRGPRIDGAYRSRHPSPRPAHRSRIRSHPWFANARSCSHCYVLATRVRLDPVPGRRPTLRVESVRTHHRSRQLGHVGAGLDNSQRRTRVRGRCGGQRRACVLSRPGPRCFRSTQRRARPGWSLVQQRTRWHASSVRSPTAGVTPDGVVYASEHWSNFQHASADRRPFPAHSSARSGHRDDRRHAEPGRRYADLHRRLALPHENNDQLFSGLTIVARSGSRRTESIPSPLTLPSRMTDLVSDDNHVFVNGYNSVLVAPRSTDAVAPSCAVRDVEPYLTDHRTGTQNALVFQRVLRASSGSDVDGVHDRGDRLAVDAGGVGEATHRTHPSRRADRRLRCRWSRPRPRPPGRER